MGNFLIKSNDFRNTPGGGGGPGAALQGGVNGGLGSTIGAQHTPMVLRSSIGKGEEHKSDYNHAQTMLNGKVIQSGGINQGK